jgi:tripartite-type tricarboxylate transporter receptor subunit TctC
VTSKERVKQLPDVPTTSEAGLPGFEYKIWYGMVASSKTPRAIVDQLAKELSAITQLKDISNAMENEGVTPRDVVTGEFDAFIAKEIAKFRDLANASGITKR